MKHFCCDGHNTDLVVSYLEQKAHSVTISIVDAYININFYVEGIFLGLGYVS